MNQEHWQARRQAVLDSGQTALEPQWDVLVIGGGITGAGICLEAARRGLKVLLVEQRDFAWGTSSRSSKLVHGGLRYLSEGKWSLTRDAVQERQRLLRDMPGLVDLQSFAFADYAGWKPGRWLFSLGLALYDRMAGQRGRHYYSASEFLMLVPGISRDKLKGGLCYDDAKTDDARLVLRVLQEASDAGACALNYLAVEEICYTGQQASGALLKDTLDGKCYRIQAKAVVNATGVWADRLRLPAADKHIRPLRGSHLVFPSWRLPVAQAVSLMHPRDGRPVFMFPWEGATLVGTTDVDHREDLQQEASITKDEVLYLMEALQWQFPALQIGTGDIVSTYAGVRPVIGSGKADPSREGRDHAVWQERGLISVAGGKLTTFRLIALDVLRHVATLLPDWRYTEHMQENASAAGLRPITAQGVSESVWQRLQGRYGRQTKYILDCAQDGELERVSGTDTLWVELRWAARHESVMHLEDLMLRRTRLGLLSAAGGMAHMPRIRRICQPELHWSDKQWETQQHAYQELWQRNYSLPPGLPALPDAD